MDECAYDIIGRYLIDILNTTDIDRHLFVFRHSDSRLIHNTDITLDDFMHMK